MFPRKNQTSEVSVVLEHRSIRPLNKTAGAFFVEAWAMGCVSILEKECIDRAIELSVSSWVGGSDGGLKCADEIFCKS